MGSVSYCTYSLIITLSNKKIYKVKVPSSSLSNLTLLVGTARAPYNHCFRFQLVLDCWREDPRERPTFDQATKILEKMMMVGNTYLNLDLVDESKAYYKEHVGEEKTTDADTEDTVVENATPSQPLLSEN